MTPDNYIVDKESLRILEKKIAKKMHACMPVVGGLIAVFFYDYTMKPFFKYLKK